MREMQKIHPLRTIREAHNLTREQLAREIGVGPATIKRAERWEPIGPDSRRRLCVFFGQTSEELGLLYSDDLTKPGNEEEGKSDVMLPATYDILTHYVQQQRYRLGAALAPGATALRVSEIIEHDSLFIPPPWRLLHGSTPSQRLIDYLVQGLLQQQRLLLLGDAGQGKTTTLKLLFTRLAGRFLEDSSSPFPIYVPLREYISFAKDALDSLWMHVGEEFPLSYEEFASLVRNKQVIFLFDGFDEIRGEITQRSVNERAACKIFRYPSLLSCRKSFFDFYLTMSPLQECYPLMIELCPLLFDELVTHYITAFCQRQRQDATGGSVASPEKIIEAIQMSPELQDLAQRPLLLLMILEVFTDPQEMGEEHWSVNKLYKKYSERWLKHEASKPDSTLKWNEKATLLQEMAWLTTMGYAPQHATFPLEELHAFVQNVLPRYLDVTEAQLLDDLCFRTLLGAAEGSTYTFLHKSFQEYYAARYIFECMRRREDLEAVERVLRTSLPFDIATFLKKMLRESSFHEKAIIAANLINAYQRNQTQAQEPTTIRQQATYYLSNLRIEPAIRFLEQICQEEPNKWVQRGIMLGLALYSGRAEMLERYMQSIREDAPAAAINTRYHLIYYGDQVGNLLDALDAPEQTITRSEKTLAALFRHLQDARYKNGWALDLFTLSALLELQGPSILLTHAWYVPFLKAFLEREHPEQGAILLQEKKRLQHTLEGAFLGKH
jgi:transcriptional regulator with XRE-family HTH domain